MHERERAILFLSLFLFPVLFLFLSVLSHVPSPTFLSLFPSPFRAHGQSNTQKTSGAPFWLPAVLSLLDSPFLFLCLFPFRLGRDGVSGVPSVKSVKGRRWEDVRSCVDARGARRCRQRVRKKIYVQRMTTALLEQSTLETNCDDQTEGGSQFLHVSVYCLPRDLFH